MSSVWQRLAGWWRTPPPRPPLGVCPECRAATVVPVRWHELGDDAWWMALRCGECGAREELVVPNADAERFGDTLDAAVAEIAAAADRLDHERLGDQAEAFAAALARDLIDAGDFR